MTPRTLQYSDLENAYDHPERIGRLAGLLNRLRGADTLVVGSGDDLAPGVCSLATRGRCALPFFRAVRPDIETFGNHDFDYGLDRTLEIVRESPQEWISANVAVEGTRFGAAEGVRPATVREVDGRRVGFVGVTDPATTDMTPVAGDLDIDDPIAAIERAVEELDSRVDFLCMLSHCGALDAAIARRCDVDAVLGGHVHDERIATIDGTVCTRLNANGRRICEIDLDAGEARFHETAEGPLDEEVQAAYEATYEETGLGEVVAVIDEPIARSRALRLGGECRAGNFVADAYRWAAGADCGLHDAGGMRDGPALAGAVRIADLVSLVPFDKRVVCCEITGRELREVLAEGYRASRGSGEPNWYAHVSGLRVVYDTSSRTVVECWIDGDDEGDDGENGDKGDDGSENDGIEDDSGELLDPDRTYTLATNDYLLATHYEVSTFTPAHRSRDLDVQWEVLAAYARERGIDPRIDGRIVLRE